MHTMIWLVILRIPGYVSLKMPDLKSVRSSKDWVNILEYAGWYVEHAQKAIDSMK